MYTPLRNTGYNKAMPTINRRALCMHPREKPFRYRTVWRQLHRPRTSPSHKSNIVTGERLAERVWCTNFQSSLIFEYSLPSQCVPVLAPAHFIPPVKVWIPVHTTTKKPLRYVTIQFHGRRGAALADSLRYKNRSQISLLICEQKPYLLWFSCRRKSYAE